jgi:hypothetical protein
MTIAANEVHYDPYDAELNADPYPMFRRLREDAPLYYNAEHDFYALSRFGSSAKVWSTMTRSALHGERSSSGSRAGWRCRPA